MNKLYSIESLKEVTDQIVNWKYEPLNGIGVFTKTEKYAHIEINIHVTENYKDQIIWSVKEEFIPVAYHQEIAEVLTFFGNYLTALKGRREKNLAFEIIDGSFNHDSGRYAFMYATIRSIISCFDKKIFEVRPMQRQQIDSAKKNGLNLIIQGAKHFSEDKIIESLQDTALTLQIRKLLNSEMLFKLKTIVQLTEAQNIVGDIFLNQEVLLQKNVVTKYGDLSRIGFAHIAVIVNNKAVLPYIGVFRLNQLEDKFSDIDL